MKEITGVGKYVIQGNIKNKKNQADNFVIDITNSEIDEFTAIKQIKNIFNSNHYLWIDKILLLKDKKFLRVYERSQL